MVPLLGGPGAPSSYAHAGIMWWWLCQIIDGRATDRWTCTTVSDMHDYVNNSEVNTEQLVDMLSPKQSRQFFAKAAR